MWNWFVGLFITGDWLQIDGKINKCWSMEIFMIGSILKQKVFVLCNDKVLARKKSGDFCL